MLSSFGCVKSNLDNSFDTQAQVFPLGLMIGLDSAIGSAANVPPADVTRASATPVDDDSIRVIWEAVGEDFMSGTASRYELRYALAPIPDDETCRFATVVIDPGVIATAGTMLNFQIDGLSPHTDYYFCIHAYDSQGSRNSWILGNVTARINPAPADVTVASATPTAFDTVRLQWDAVGEDNNIGAAARYEIVYSTTAIGNDAACDAATILDPGVTPVTAGTTISYDLVGLINQTTYYFCIRAYDSEDKGNRWTYGLLSATTPEGTAGWGPWSAFGACSATCAGGTMTQTRTCLVPADGCAGAASNTVACNTHACPTWSGDSSFAAASGSLSCPAGYHVTNVTCNPGQIAFEAFDFFCHGCACGLLSRGGSWHMPTVDSHSGVGSSTGSCDFEYAIGNNTPPIAACQVHVGFPGRFISPWPHLGPATFFVDRLNQIDIDCQQTP